MSLPAWITLLKPSAAWYESRHFRRAAFTLAATLVLVEGYLAVFARRGDFLFHRNLGGAFLSGDPYALGGDWYPLARVMMNALLALPPVYVARALCYSLAMISIAIGYTMWRKIAEERWPAPRTLSFAAGTLNYLLLLPLVLRDLDECGLQTILLFFLTAGGYALWRGRSAAAGFWLATAASYKITPVLCLPLLLWKRQWKAAGWMAAFTILWALAPALFIGWRGMVDGNIRWFNRMREVSAVHEAYPSMPGFEEPKPHNLSLQAMLARYLETYPPGHPLYMEHRAFVQFGSLDAETAYRAVKGILLIFGLGLAWRFRQRWSKSPDAADFAVEWSAVCLLCALLSPICWKQHLVLILPAMFLVLRTAMLERPISRWRWALIGLIGSIILLGRHAIGGREFSIVLMSYKLDTLAVLVLLGLVLSIGRLKRLVCPAAEKLSFNASLKTA